MSADKGWRFAPLKEDRGRTREKVAPFYDAYDAVYQALKAAGQYPYNDSFVGRIPGIEGPDEHWGIYHLQVERRLRETEAQVAAALADGLEPITFADVAEGEQIRYERLVQYGWYMHGEGFKEFPPGGRLTRYYSSLAVLPKGARTRGKLCSGHVLIARKPS